MQIPNARERKVLRVLQFSEWEFHAKLGTGAKTFASLIENGWIELFRGTNLTGDRYSITEAGKAALALKPPVQQISRSPLKQLPSRLKEMPPRLSRLSKKT